MRVLIAAPLRQDPKIFRLYQDALDRLILPDGVTVDRFFVVNDCPEVIPEIRGEYVVVDTHDQYQKTHNDHIWTDRNLRKMHDLRQITCQQALKGGYDYLFSVDTDLILRPETLQTLLETGKDIVSELFWTKGWCNAWQCDQSTGMNPAWRVPGLYQVGMTGACILISRKVLEAGADYAPIPNIHKALWGEDRHFSIRAACLGFELWTDSHCPPAHLYTEQAYQDYRRCGHAERVQAGDADRKLSL